MKRFLNIMLLLLLLRSGFSQTALQSLLDSVSTNNKTLIAAQQLAESQRINAKTGMYPENPKVSYDRLSHATAPYSELLITQSFDFPTAYVHKSKIAGVSKLQADEHYRKTKIEILTNTAQVYSELVYINRKTALFSKRQEMAQKLLAGVEKRLTLGDANIFEVNRVKTEKAKTQTEFQLTESRRKALLAQLSELNGGRAMLLNDTLYPVLSNLMLNDSSLTQFSENNPEVKQWENQTKIAKSNIDLQKSLSFPKFDLGYRQDITTSQTFNGFHAGITIPLFENKNTVKSAKVNYFYTTQAADATRLEIQSKLSRIIAEYEGLHNAITEMNAIVEQVNTPNLLFKAYNAGQISYSEFFTEYENYQSAMLYLEDLKFKAALLQMKLHIISAF